MTVYFIRHGETELNRLHIVQGSGMDSDLNNLGQAQSKAFFDAYQHIDFDLVVTSRLKRTHQTVHHFLQRDIPWHQTADINEISWGIYEGTTSSPERKMAFMELLHQWRIGNLDAALPKGESARELGERVIRFIDWLRGREERRILVATHGRTLRALVSYLKDIPLSDMDAINHLNTGCYVARFEGDEIHFELENDVSHLEAARLITNQ